jgi:hypothetical protein
MDLSNRLEATIPFQVKPGKQLLKMMRNRGDRIDADTSFNVTSVMYSGDAGGISGKLERVNGKSLSTTYVVSMTQVTIDPNHPLAAEVQAYQQRRIRLLKLQDTSEFVKELVLEKKMPKRKSSKGFGK